MSDAKQPGRHIIPLRLERVLFLAATDEPFRTALLRDRLGAVRAAGLELGASEAAILAGAPEPALRSLIESLDTAPSNIRRRTFLRATAASLVTLAAGQPTSGCEATARSTSAQAVVREVSRAGSGSASFSAGAIAASTVTIDQPEALVLDAVVFIELDGEDLARARIDLVTPSETRVRVIEGNAIAAGAGRGPAKRSLKGWYGDEGTPARLALAALRGEPASGAWRLLVHADGGSGTLKKWILKLRLVPSSSLAGIETYGEYGMSPNTGCDCG
jgi:subtilisin-like proprotein convertase family protein